MNKLLLLGLLAASAMAVPAPAELQQNRDLDCLELEDELFSCMAVKAVSALDRAARSSDIQLISGITFVRDAPMERSAKNLKTEVDVMNELPRDLSDRTLKLIGMFYDSAVSFAKSHSLKFNMPEGSISRALSEGRGKIKKMILPLIAAVGIKVFALVPILLGGLGLLALKALFVGKIALLLAGVLAFQKLFGSGSSSVGSIFGKSPQIGGNWYEPAAQGWANPGAGAQQQGYYRRSFDAENGKVDAQTLAYSAHAPSSNEAN